MNALWKQRAERSATLKHPMQPVFLDENRTARFKANAIVRLLLDDGPFDMNRLATMTFSDEDRAQFAQLIGYSVSGAHELEYVSDEVCAAAMTETKRLLAEEKKNQ